MEETWFHISMDSVRLEERVRGTAHRMRSLSMLYPHVTHQNRSRSTFGPLALLIPREVPDLEHGISTPLFLANRNEQPASFDQRCCPTSAFPRAERSFRRELPV
jgi:hypothetical protein